MGSRHSH